MIVSGPFNYCAAPRSCEARIILKHNFCLAEDLEKSPASLLESSQILIYRYFKHISHEVMRLLEEVFRAWY
jgi:hypothetical protein